MANRFVPYGEGYLTAEQRLHQARIWVDRSPQASEARREIFRILSDGPIHSAALGEFGERFEIPKPVSSVIRELCGVDVSFYTAKTSPTGSPALALTDRAADERYWLKFRKSLDAVPEAVGVSPWTMLGVPAKANLGGNAVRGGCLAYRAEFFASFMKVTYGVGQIKGMAAVCLDFKKICGMSFADFFDGLRPAEFMNSDYGRSNFSWSWTTATPPCLNCSVRDPFAPRDRLVAFVPSSDVVAELVPEAMKNLPENIDLDRFRATMSLDEARVCYLHALKRALKIKIEGVAEAKSSVSTDEAIKQLLEVSRDLAAAANKIASIAERLLASSNK